MRGMLAPLSTHEEATLRKIGFGSSELLQLELIEWAGHHWRLTIVGRERYGNLVIDVGQRPAA
jgi:hypothetical protein